MRCARLWIVAVPIDAINIFGAVVKLVVTEFFLEIQGDHEDTHHAGRKTDEIDGGVCFALEEIPQGDLKVVPDHRRIDLFEFSPNLVAFNNVFRFAGFEVLEGFSI